VVVILAFKNPDMDIAARGYGKGRPEMFQKTGGNGGNRFPLPF
jgi:hypothetical protein